MIHSLKAFKAFIEETHPWNGAARSALYRDYFFRERKSTERNETHLRATIEWLKRAQDAPRDGGVSGRYHIRTGWSSSYPETTGYIAATFIAAAARLDAAELTRRAGRMIEFLLSVQMANGAFPGGELDGSERRPVVF